MDIQTNVLNHLNRKSQSNEYAEDLHFIKASTHNLLKVTAIKFTKNN